MSELSYFSNMSPDEFLSLNQDKLPKEVVWLVEELQRKNDILYEDYITLQEEYTELKESM